MGSSTSSQSDNLPPVSADIGTSEQSASLEEKILAELLDIGYMASLSDVEQPAIRDEASPKRTTYTAGDILELRTNAFQYEKELLVGSPTHLLTPPYIERT